MPLNTPGSPLTITPDITPVYSNTVELTFRFDPSLLYTSSTLDFLVDPVYFWDFGDGSYSFDAVATHKYTTPGRYKVRFCISGGTTTLSGEIDTQGETVLLAEINDGITRELGLVPNIAFRAFAASIVVEDFVKVSSGVFLPALPPATYSSTLDINLGAEVVPKFLEKYRSLTDLDSTAFNEASAGFERQPVHTIDVLQSHQTPPFTVKFISPISSPHRITLYARGSDSAPANSKSDWAGSYAQWCFKNTEDSKVTDIIVGPESVLYLELVNTDGVYSWARFPNSKVNLDTNGNIINENVYAVGTIVSANLTYTDDIPKDGVALCAVVDTISAPGVNGNKLFTNSSLGELVIVNIKPSTPTGLRIDIRKGETAAGYTWTGALTPCVVSIVDSDGVILKDRPLSGDTSLSISSSEPNITFSGSSTIMEGAGLYVGSFKALQKTSNAFTVSATGIVDGVRLYGVSDPVALIDYVRELTPRKFNASFDMTEQLREYTLQESLAKSTVLFEEIIRPFVGDYSFSEDCALGRVVYEKIANLPANTVDIDTCNINYINGLLLMTGQHRPDDNLYPAGINNVLSLWSMPLDVIQGSYEILGQDIQFRGSIPSNVDAYLTRTSVLSAGQIIVAHRKYAPESSIVQVGSMSVGELRLTEYTLGQFVDASGGMPWGFDINEYEFYSYKPTTPPYQVTGAINWADPLTTMLRSDISNNIDLDGEMIDRQMDYQLCRGLGLFE